MEQNVAQILVVLVEQIEGQANWGVNATKVLPSACHGVAQFLGPLGTLKLFVGTCPEVQIITLVSLIFQWDYS